MPVQALLGAIGEHRHVRARELVLLARDRDAGRLRCEHSPRVATADHRDGADASTATRRRRHHPAAAAATTTALATATAATDRHAVRCAAWATSGASARPPPRSRSTSCRRRGTDPASSPSAPTTVISFWNRFSRRVEVVALLALTAPRRRAARHSISIFSLSTSVPRAADLAQDLVRDGGHATSRRPRPRRSGTAR